MPNQRVYQRSEVVRAYAGATDLQPPEKRILELLRDELSEASMLDIGVGGGRTTAHFAPAVREYVGIDYSAEMISACRRRFPAGRYRFELCDVRDLSRFPDGGFDFVLFSFNGIDDVSPADRRQAFREMSRVGRPGGYLCFSTHNLQGLDHGQFTLRRQVSGSPGRMAKNLAKWLLTRAVYNRHLRFRELAHAPHAVIHHFDHRRLMPTYYVRPAAQREQLGGHCRDVRVFSLVTGREVSDEDRWGELDDPWLYYLGVLR